MKKPPESGVRLTEEVPPYTVERVARGEYTVTISREFAEWLERQRRERGITR